jgi:hypothetical protein
MKPVRLNGTGRVCRVEFLVGDPEQVWASFVSRREPNDGIKA